MDTLSRTREKGLSKADFCIVQESAFLDSTDNVYYCNNPYYSLEVT